MYRIKVDDWREIPLKNLQFIMNQAELRLNYTIQNSDKITNRYFSILVLLLAVFSASVGFFSSLYAANFYCDATNILNLAFLTFLFVEIYLFAKNINARKFMGPGRQPSELQDVNFLQPNDKITEEQQYKGLLLSEINNLEEKIVFNTSQNSQRISTLKKLISSLLLLLASYTILLQLLVVL